MTEPPHPAAAKPAAAAPSVPFAAVNAYLQIALIRLRLQSISRRIHRLSTTTNEGQVQADTSGIANDISIIATDLTDLSNDIGSLVAQLQPGNQVTAADVAALNAVKSSADALVTAANAAVANAGSVVSTGTIANTGT